MEIRLATINDASDLLNWRNDLLSISMSESSHTVTPEEHANWVIQSLSNPNRTIFIGILKDLKIGVCRFDYDPQDNCSETSINLNPICRNRGFSKILLAECIKHYQLINKNPLKAKVKKNNYASIKLFEKCNFVLEEMSENFCIYFFKN